MNTHRSHPRHSRQLALTGLLLFPTLASPGPLVQGGSSWLQGSRHNVFTPKSPTPVPSPLRKLDAARDLVLTRLGDKVQLTNNWDQPLLLKTQDGDPYLKLEYKKSDGTWARAQAHHDSWCGNSYFPGKPLAAGANRLYSAYRPKSGRTATLRYTLYRQSFEISTPEFAGVVNDEQIAAAASDGMAMRNGSLATVRGLALGLRSVPRRTRRDIRWTAIRRVALLAKTDPEAKKVLAEIADQVNHLPQPDDLMLELDTGEIKDPEAMTEAEAKQVERYSEMARKQLEKLTR